MFAQCVRPDISDRKKCIKPAFCHIYVIQILHFLWFENFSRSDCDLTQIFSSLVRILIIKQVLFDLIEDQSIEQIETLFTDGFHFHHNGVMVVV